MKDIKIPRPTIPTGNPIAKTFGEKLGIEMNTTEELMNYIIFGNPKEKGFFPENNKGEF